jgi:DNA-binding LytR/AlgR family response regulator
MQPVTKLKCVIIDDEPGAIYILETYISMLHHLELIGRFSNAVTALNFLLTTKADVLLLDINMPELTGFQLLESMSQLPAVIMTTAYSDYAVKAFEYEVTDYLQKPIRFERFVKAIEKVQRRTAQQILAGPTDEYIELKTDGLIRQVRFTDILYIESLRNYVKIYTLNKHFLVLMTIGELETQMPRRSFVRTHKSFIVNASKIDRMQNERLVLGHIELPIGKIYKKYFDEYIKTNGLLL